MLINNILNLIYEVTATKSKVRRGTDYIISHKCPPKFRYNRKNENCEKSSIRANSLYLANPNSIIYRNRALKHRLGLSNKDLL